MDKITITASDGLVLHGLYADNKDPKALIQIMHGMAEHKERYEKLIDKLNEEGYAVLITDMRGHGESVNEEFSLGHCGTKEQLVADQYELTKFLKEKHPGKDLYIFAHSMGTLTCREYLKTHDDEVKKVILSGTVNYKPGCGLGVSLAKRRKNKNPKGYSKLLFAMSNNFSTKVDFSWLSTNKENVKNYEADPLCGFEFTNLSNFTLFSLTKNLHDLKSYNAKNKDLKILSISGELDRTTGGKKGLKDTVKTLNKVGYQNVSVKEYPNMKHEILMENDNDMVFEDIINFFGE
ncbi:MAG: alpha/beta hydrolase [Acholeplasmatales bacterium]|nr:alpha/beta hydrolase [Acholeplasmatales bacterium]